MLSERLRSILRGPAGAIAPQRPFAPGNSTQFVHGDSETATRTSRALEQFFHTIRDQVGLSILDLSGLNQENVNFITNLGHRLYSEDLVRALDDTFGGEDQSNPGRIDHFLAQTLDFPEEQFEGILVWDVLQYMQPPLLAATMERLHRIARRNACLLAVFHSDERAQIVPLYEFRIRTAGSLTLDRRGARKPAQLFNNRGLEKLFQHFDSVKFFLSREMLREVIVRR